MSGSSHEFQSTVSAERSSIEFDSQEDENQQRIDCIRPRDRSFSEPVQTSEDENQQGIDNIRERLRSFSEDVQPSEYVNQLEEYNQPRLGPISEFEQANESSTSQVNEYEYQQTIEDIQPRMRSMSRLDRAIEYENHKVDFIQSRLSPIPELEQANADEYEQGIEHVQPIQRSISTHMQPDEYENQQGMDNIHSRLSSISELEQVNEYEIQQGMDNIHSRLSSISELEQINEYENQQGIDNIQSRLSSISEYDDQEVIEYAPKLRSSTISESEQANEYEKKEIEYDHVKINSTTYTEMRKAQEVLKNLQQVDFIQTKLRSTEVTDAHQQEKQGTDIPSEHADQDEHRQGIIYVPATESSTEKRSEEEIQQEKHDEVLNEFPEHKFIFRDLKSDEQLHW